MDNIFLEEFQGVDFTKNQKIIAQYCIDHQYKVCQQTLSEIAAHVGVTEVTMLKFVRKLGYAGFAEFKSSAFARLSERMQAQGISLSERMKGNAPQDTDSPDIDTYVKRALNNVERSLTQNKQESYQQAADWMIHAKQLLVFGCRSAATGAEHFARLVCHVQSNVRVLSNDLTLAMLTISGAEPGDVLILFCKKRYYKSDVALCKLAKETGVRLILVTDSVLAPVVSFADLVLVASVDGISFFDSTLGIAAIQEYLAYLVAEHAEEAVKKRWEITDQYTRDCRF